VNGERWDRVQQLVEDALNRPEPARRAFVESACPGDAELRDEVLSLLAADAAGDLPAPWLGALASPESDRFAPGDRIADRYRIRAQIGRGGMGEVYEADDEELGITVALKTLREMGGRREALELLKLEGMLARAVWHPNVCRVYELGRHEDGPSSLWFLAMERLHGPTLEERLRDAGRLPLDVALHFAEGMGAALGAAHRAGVVHRDLKPGNVMLVVRDGEEHAIVTDFGTGRAAAQTNAGAGADAGAGMRPSGAVVGTLAYMPPEQRRGEDVGPAADVYALGMVLHEMVTGTLPAPDSTAPGLDARWGRVIRRCLDRDPRRRFARAEDVASALAGGDPIDGPSVADRATARRSTLPSERDPFVGRDGDLDALERARTDGARLVTLVGPGGMGKTRLAIRFAARTADTWSGGVWFCDLTEAKSADGIASAVGGSLGVQLGGGDPIRQLGHAIDGRGACLLVLDNCEQVVAPASAAIERWRAQAPDAVFVVTSRERLGLADERTHAVESLSASEAMNLFTLRARGLRPGLEIAGVDAEAAREIVRLLDGIPLAIELAAARIRVMSLAQILEGMRKRFRLLAGGTAARHETLEGAIDGSWDSLTPWERAAWSQCSVFEAGCTLEAATGVLDLSAWPEAPPVVDVLRSLVDKSLLRTWAPGAEAGESAPDVRFGMYVSLQEYARTKLRAGDGLERAAEARHGVYYARFGGDEAMSALERHGAARTRRLLERELENLIGACRRAIARDDGPTAARTFRAACSVLKTRGPLGTALELGRDALASPAVRGADRAIVAGTLGEAEWHAGRYEDARTHCEAALAIAHDLPGARIDAKVAVALGRVQFTLGNADEARASLATAVVAAHAAGDRQARCLALNALGMVHHETGRSEEARTEYEEALAIAREIGDRGQEAVTLLSLGILEQKRARFDDASELFEAALAIHRETGNRRSEGVAHVNLGSVRTDQGRTAEARRHTEASLAIAREIGSRRGEGVALAALGETDLELGDLAQARAHFEASRAIHRELGDRRVEGILIANLARVHELEGDTTSAREGYEAALAIHRSVGDRPYEGACLVNLGSALLAAGSLDEARDALAAAEPILHEIGARHEQARLLALRAELEHARENQEAARSALREAESLAAELGTTGESELGRALARARQALDRRRGSA
jgi:predicted ATPase/Tfp pilus assembly protein PilF